MLLDILISIFAKLQPVCCFVENAKKCHSPLLKDNNIKVNIVIYID